MTSRITFTNGCFDVLTYGHLELLRYARSFGEMLVVGVNSDDSVRRLKGEGRPMNSLVQRMAMLRELRCVDVVLSFEGDRCADLIRKVKPHTYVKSAEYQSEDDLDPTELAVLKECNTNIVFMPPVASPSTTQILKGVME